MEIKKAASILPKCFGLICTGGKHQFYLCGGGKLCHASFWTSNRAELPYTHLQREI